MRAFLGSITQKERNKTSKKAGLSGAHLGLYGRESSNVTPEYRELVGAAKAGKRKMPANAKDLEYLFIPGLLTNHYGEIYMKTNLERCAQLGLNARKLALNTAASVEQNAVVIRDEIQKAKGKVMVLGHSKGAVDAAAAFVMFPELYEKVHAFISIQAPYGGSYVASWFVDNKAMRLLTERVIEDVLKGEEACMSDITYEKRKLFLEKHPQLDTKRLPTICFASVVEGGPMGVIASLLKSKYGVQSDGLVPELDAIIPGAALVNCRGVDHGGTVMTIGLKAEADQPADITQALIYLALSKK